MAKSIPHWSHPSIRKLAGDRDPVTVIVDEARRLALEAMEGGWSGPPFDPFGLADHLRIPVVPCADVDDARTVPRGQNKFQIEFNPNRSFARVRYSIAHEIAHTLFPDCSERVRNREHREHMEKDDWQLEMLCNLAAAELLMPTGSLPDFQDDLLTIDEMLKLRRKFDVSSEAMLLRMIRLSSAQCAAFASSTDPAPAGNVRYKIDYVRNSSTWSIPIPNYMVLPSETVVAECTGIGYTAKGDEFWPVTSHSLHIECLGIPPYPGHRYPRVIGIVRPSKPKRVKGPQIEYVRGDATQPRKKSKKIIAHIVNDRAVTWGGRGFAQALRRSWPSAYEDFRAWVVADKKALLLGNIRVSNVKSDLAVVHMVAQHGYGDSAMPRIRYGALVECLRRLACVAEEHRATIHLPRIGTGEAGGSWNVIKELLDTELVRRGLSVTIYDLPSAQGDKSPGANHKRAQLGLNFGN